MLLNLRKLKGMFQHSDMYHILYSSIVVEVAVASTTPFRIDTSPLKWFLSSLTVVCIHVGRDCI
jgi:hypothetical protein